MFICNNMLVLKKPNKETEWQDYSLQATVLALWPYHIFVQQTRAFITFDISSLLFNHFFNKSSCNKSCHKFKCQFQMPAAILQAPLESNKTENEPYSFSFALLWKSELTLPQSTACTEEEKKSN